MTGRSMSFDGHIRRIVTVLGAVFANRELRRVLFAFAAFNAVEWGAWLTMIVYAYDQGGATTAGLVAFAQLVPSAVIAPIAAVLGDRRRPGRVLALGYAVQAATVLGAAVALIGDAAPIVVYAFGALASMAMTLSRPPQSALVPTLARSPLELTAANVASGWVESVTVLVAPALAGVLLALSGPGLAFLVFGCLIATAVVLVLPVPGPAPAGGRPDAGVLTEVGEGFAMLRREPEPRTLVLLLGAQYVGIGALDVLYPILAIGALEAGSSWAGYLNAGFGAGGALGIGVTIVLVGRRHLLGPLLLGVVLWAGALVVLALITTRVTALVLLAVAGMGRAVVDVAGRTLLQRSARTDLLARVFGLLEGLSMAGLALGSLLVPVLVKLGGATAALVGVAGVFPLAALAVGRRLRRIDQTADVPVVEIGLLRSIPIFAPLTAPTLESIARSLQPLSVTAGTAVVTQGEDGHRWYAIADGRFEVVRGAEHLAELGRGQAFGEIALLRDVPRTATVTALTDSALYVLEKDDFLEAVTGHPRVTEEADRVVERHLATHR
jgi:MFS family permease